MDRIVLNQWNLDLNSTLEKYDTADNSTSGDLPSDFNWDLFYYIGLAFLSIAILLELSFMSLLEIAVARIRNKTTRIIWMKNLIPQVFQALSQTPTCHQESQTLNQESQIRNL